MSKRDRAYAHPIGVSVGDMTPPEQLGEKARWLEELGYSHIMVPEDYFYVPALVGATLALSATRAVPVGTSIVSGLVRHPAVLAMEIAGISRAFPGRFRPGIGLGLPAWLEQMGLLPEKPVTALRESVTSIQRLLAGETVTLEGKQVQLDAIGITHPALEHVPITLGVMGPMLLELSGQIADGTLFGAAAGLDFFRWAMSQVEKGLATSGRSSEAMSYSTVALTCVQHDGAAARAAARPILASFLGEFGVNTLTDAYGISGQVTEILERGGPDAMAAEMPDQWLEDLTLVGSPGEVVEKMRRWLAAGIDSICIFLPDEELERATLELVAAEVIPALRGA
jgi:alkanesulfonate monooxygenase SsuD/methylene tetrahydromethanopterin reductase-like flavin-dependent oxidoreductase (luciferase family)